MKTMLMMSMIVLGSVTMSYANPTNSWDIISESSSVKFTLSSTLHDVPGDVTALSGKFVQEQASFTGQAIFPISSMKTYNGIRDRKMMRMFESDQYPDIVYVIDSMDSLVEQPSGSAHIEGRLTIHGITQDCPLDVDTSMVDGKLVLAGEKDVQLSDFDLKAPGVFGIIRVADTVKVEFRLEMMKQLTEVAYHETF